MVTPSAVHDTLRRHLLVDGFEFVLDTAASQGSTIVDARDGTRYLDMFSFFASSALGMNHPALRDDQAFIRRLTEVAVNKPSNSDIYTTHLAAFTETFARVLGDPRLPHYFFIEGGGLAVENALKTAFDWKSRHNAANGRDPDRGTQVLHLTSAFHGRTGYTLSLTNTEPVKIARFPKFGWPRVDAPVVRFPLSEHQAEVEAAEQIALEQAREAFAANPDDIACFIAEPIQGEGGDNHFRPQFLSQMLDLCHANDALFVLDEIQTGCGLTGTAWCYEQFGLEPDIVAFGKKTQVCGIMAGGRVGEVADNVFVVSSRLNSTWGGNLTDMVRAQRILEVIEADGLLARAAAAGRRLLDGLLDLGERHAELVSNARGRGLMCAFDLPDAATRDALLTRLRDEEQVLLIGSGERSVRFRPALTVTDEELDMACAALDRGLKAVAS